MSTIWIPTIAIMIAVGGVLTREVIRAMAAKRPEEELVKPLQFSRYDLSALRERLPAWDIRFGNWVPGEPPDVTDGSQNAISGTLKGTESRHGVPGQGPVVFTFWRSRYETVEEAFEQAIPAFDEAEGEYGHLREGRS